MNLDPIQGAAAWLSELVAQGVEKLQRTKLVVTGVAFFALLVEGSAASDPAVKCTCYAGAAAAAVAYVVAQAYVDRR